MPVADSPVLSGAGSKGEARIADQKFTILDNCGYDRHNALGIMGKGNLTSRD
jgi:hypothetical protein